MDPATIQITICGHAKSGKSTLAGRLAVELNAPGLTQERVKSFAEEAESRNQRFGKKDFNKYNLIFLPGAPSLPQGTKEGTIRSSSRTVFPTRGSLEFDGTRLTLIDTPGHDTFLNNIAYGIFQSDAAILTVEPEGDLAVKKGTELICRLISAFDVEVAAICITKMDRLGYSQEVFETLRDEIVVELIEKYRLGLTAAIPIIPVAALSPDGDNVTKRNSKEASNMPWYCGPTVAEAISMSRRAESAIINGPVRFAVEGPAEIFSPGVGTVLVGLLEAGTLKLGQTLIAEPFSSANQDERVRVKSLQLGGGALGGNRQALKQIGARCSIAVAITDWSREKAEKILRHGGMFGEVGDRPRVAKKIRATILFFSEDKVYHGKDYKILLNVSFAMGRFLSVRVKQDGWMDLSSEVLNVAQTLGLGEWVEAEIEFHQRSICIETSETLSRLARFGIAEGNRVVGCGKCIAILE